MKSCSGHIGVVLGTCLGTLWNHFGIVSKYLKNRIKHFWNISPGILFAVRGQRSVDRRGTRSKIRCWTRYAGTRSKYLAGTLWFSAPTLPRCERKQLLKTALFVWAPKANAPQRNGLRAVALTTRITRAEGCCSTHPDTVDGRN